MHIPTRLIVAFVATCALACAPSATADEITYTYTGNQFTSFGGSATCPTECNITGSFTLSAPIPSNFSGFFVPDSFSFTDGLVTFTKANATSFAFGFITDSLGDLTAWNLNFIDPSISMFVGTGTSAICPMNCTVTDGSFAPSGPNPINYAQVVDDPGKWSSAITATPEPSTFVLLGTGILGLAGMARRKLSL